MDEDSIFLGKEHLRERIEGALRALGGPLTKVLEAEGAKRTPSIMVSPAVSFSSVDAGGWLDSATKETEGSGGSASSGLLPGRSVRDKGRDCCLRLLDLASLPTFLAGFQLSIITPKATVTSFKLLKNILAIRGLVDNEGWEPILVNGVVPLKVNHLLVLVKVVVRETDAFVLILQFLFPKWSPF